MRTRVLRSLSLAGLAVSVGMGTCHVASGAPDEVIGLATASLGLELFLALAAVSLAALSRRPLAERLGLGAGRLSWGRLAILVVGTLALSHGLDGILELSGLRAHSSLARLDAVLAGATGAALGLALLAIGLAPGIAEEILCRGLVQRGLERRAGPVVAIVLAALCFGALHVDPIHAAFAALLGLYLGATAWLTGSTRAPMLCHAINNLVAVWLAARLPGAVPHDAVGTAAAWMLAAACLAWVGRAAPLPPPAPAIDPESPRDPTAGA